MKLIEHVYALKNLLARGVPSDDFTFSNRLLAHYLKIARSKLIEEKADKYHYISDQSFQSLCLDLEEGNFHNCCEGPTIDCYVLKSSIKLPKFLNTRWGDFAKVMTLDGKVLPKTSLTINKLSKYSLTNRKPRTGWFIHDERLYVINNKHLEKILVNSLFDDPEEINTLNCGPDTNTPCADFMDQEYPIDPDLVGGMYQLAMNFLLNSYRLPARDDENNATDDGAQNLRN